MRAESGVTSPVTKASSLDSSRAAPVQRFQCPATYQSSQAAATRNMTRSAGNSHRMRPLDLGGLVAASFSAADMSLIESPATNEDGLSAHIPDCADRDRARPDQRIKCLRPR